jgi:hypothetical protein
MRKTTLFTRTVLVLGAAFAAAPAYTLPFRTITVQECLANALGSYQEARRQCARLDSWWEWAMCDYKAWRDYQLARDLCYSDERPVMPVLPVPVPNPQGRPVA